MANQIERLLVLEDNDAQTLFWEMLIPEFNIQVFKSRAGAEALEIVEKENIQMVVVAWELKSMPGTAFVQKARATRKRRRMPFLIYSSRMTAEDVSFAKDLGLDNLLPLPLDKTAARAMLQGIIERESAISPMEIKLRKMEDCLAEGRPSDVLKLVGPDVSKKGSHQPRYKTIIGETFLLCGQMEKAEKAIKEALELDPDYLPAKYLLARYYTIAGKHDDAIAMLDHMSNSNPKNMQTLVNLGSAYISADRVDEAKETVAKAKNLDLDTQDIKDVEGKIAVKEGNLSLAAQLFSETENGDEVARFYNSLAISLVAKGNFDKGIETYQSAIKILGNKAKLYLLFFNLALAYRKHGDHAQSLTYLCECYIADPGFERAYAAIARAVAEFKVEKKELPMSQITLVKDTRRRYFEENPKAAEKIKARLEERNKTKLAS